MERHRREMQEKARVISSNYVNFFSLKFMIKNSKAVMAKEKEAQELARKQAEDLERKRAEEVY